MHCGSLNGKEIQKREGTRTPIVDLLCYTVATDSAVKRLYSMISFAFLARDFPGSPHLGYSLCLWRHFPNLNEHL